MGWLVALVLVPFLALTAMVTTFVLMIVLNGYPSLPGAMVNVYLISAGLLIPGLSILAGFLAQKVSARRGLSLWIGGLLIGAAASVVLPVILFGLTFALLAAFGML